MSDRVKTVTHDLLVRELGQVPQWDILGTYLELSEGEIQVIERDHHDTARRRLVMLNKWMEKDVNASWEKVIDALKSMSQIRLANQLKEKYCTSESTLPDTLKQAESTLQKLKWSYHTEGVRIASLFPPKVGKMRQFSHLRCDMTTLVFTV